MIRRPQKFTSERVVFSYDHAALTTSVAVKMFTAKRKMVIENATYSNPTGLAENSSNSFAVKVQRANALTFTTFSITPEADDEIVTATAHGMLTGDGPVRLGGTAPTGLATTTDYWIIKINADTFYLAASRALAMIGTNLTYTSDGTTVTLIAQATTTRLTDVATGVDTDSDGAGTNTLVADSPVSLTLSATATNLIFDADEHVYFVAEENGTATLPIGRMVVEGRYL